MNFAPFFWNERDGEQISTQVKKLSSSDRKNIDIIVTILNSTIFYMWFIELSDCRHLNLREINNFPVSLENINSILISNLERI